MRRETGGETYSDVRDKTAWGVNNAFYKEKVEDCYQEGNPYS